MLKIKYLLPVFVIVLLFGLSNSAFAQVVCSTASTPVSRDTLTGLTEPAGDITFNCTQSGATLTTAATITVDYQGAAQITNNTVYPAGKPISITGGAVAPCTFAAPGPSVPAGNVSNSTGQITITVPAEGAVMAAGATCSFTLTGVLFAFNAGTTRVAANLSVSPGNGIGLISGQTTPTVVTSVLDGVCPGAQPCPGGATGISASGAPATVLTAGTIIAPTGALNIKENYIDFFRSAGLFNSGNSTQGVQLQFTFANLPTGATLTCAGTMAAADKSATGTVTNITPATGTVTGPAAGAANPTLIVEVTGAVNLAVVDTITETCTFAAGTATLPLPLVSVTATVAVAPVGAAFGAGGAVLTAATTGQIPRYVSTPLTPAVTLVNIISTTTNILFPFITLSSAYDSGFAIANTTADPFGPPVAATGTGGARPQSGTVTLAFYPSTGAGTPFCITSGAVASSPGVAGLTCTPLNLTVSTNSGGGLGAGGVLATGSTWSFVLSDLIKSSSATSFNGYVFAITNFSNSHATSFVADPSFVKFAVGGTALVLTNPAAAGFGRNALFGLAESLGH